MKIKNFLWCALAAFSILSSCSDDDDPLLIPELKSSGMKDNTLALELGNEINITPEVSSEDLNYEWKINNEEVSNQLQLKYKPEKKGIYNIHFTASNVSGKVECDYKVTIVSVKPKITNSGLENNAIEITYGEEVVITPELNTDDLTYEWKLDDKIISEEATLQYTPVNCGDITIHFKASNSSGEVELDYAIKVNVKIREKSDISMAYLTTMFEYVPAPGQFVNENGIGTKDGAEKILGKPNTGMITLGGFGGYVIAGFDHTILNSEGHDLAIYGNAFEGSSEPGIVMVSFDYNGNGKADDEWFELAGSEYNAEKTIHNYEITYTNPKGYKDVPWTDNQGNSGVVKINDFHYNHNYYPEFIEDQESITFKGTLIENKTDLNYSHPDYGTIVWNPAREWGYADNYSSEYDNLHANTLDFDWAVNDKGEKVSLPGVDFIKVYTATNADGGWLGEVSTEIMGAADLSML